MSNKKGMEELDERIQKLESKIKRLEREKKKLQSENKTLKDAWKKTEEHIHALTKDKSIDEVFQDIEEKTELTKITKECPNCGKRKMRKIQHSGFYIESCENKNCGYRNRINEGRSRKA